MAHHRSGSNFLNDLLQSHPCIECVNEPLSMHTSYFRECDLSRWSAEDFDPRMLHLSLAPHWALRSFLVDLREYLLQSNSIRVIGFKETVLFGKLDWLKVFIPSLKILFLQRDPRAIVSSVLRSNLLSFWNYVHLVPPLFKAMHPDYVSRSRSVDEATRAAEIAAMSVVVRCEMARGAIQKFDHMELHLGALMRRPREQLEQIIEFLGVESDDGPLSFLRKRQLASRGGPYSSFRLPDDVERAWERHLTADQIRAIEDVLQCGLAD
ncbi:MAG: sulfotransferase [Burkholderiales bacterium]|jgi:hypothetical protein|nr:sulfotransferase [Burkholderiales bacterium]